MRSLELLLCSNDPSKNRGAGASEKRPAAPMTQIVAAMLCEDHNQKYYQDILTKCQKSLVL
jgi:hypothetical protein